MRRLTLIALFLCVFITQRTTYAQTHYQSYESMTIYEGKLLENFTDQDYKDHYPKVTRRKFMGWRVHHMHKNIKVSYISDTLFSYYNDGTTAIDYTYKLDRKLSTKFNISATGTIGIKMQKSEKTFKNNLDGSLKLSADYTVSSEEKESFEVKLKVDPQTQVDLYIYGEGKITNGVAARYIFWMRADRGGYEVFLITTQYHRLEKKPI